MKPNSFETFIAVNAMNPKLTAEEFRHVVVTSCAEIYASLPKKLYDIELIREASGYKTINLMARTAFEAQEKALDVAGNYIYDEKHVNYYVASNCPELLKLNAAEAVEMDISNWPDLEFQVEICRVGYGFTTMTELAISEVHAENQALDKAGDLSYTEKNSEYLVISITCVS